MIMIVYCVLAVLFLAGCAPSNPFVQKDIALYHRGVELVNADKDLDAAEYFKKVLEANPKHPLAHYNLGVIYDDKGMFDEAIAEFQKALDVNPKNVDAHYRLGIALATQGSDEEAVAQLQQVLLSEPSHIPSHYNLAVLYSALGRTDSAIDEYRKVIDIKPDYAEALNNLGLAYAEKGMGDVAQQYLEKAIAQRPGYVEALNNLGVVLISKEQFDKAAETFRTALKQNPKSAQALFNLAKVNFENLRDYRAAVEYATRYLALGGNQQNREEVDNLLTKAKAQLDQLQVEAASSVEARIRRDAKEFILAVQKADFRDFYIFQPRELRETLTREEWERDLAGMNTTNLSEQKSALVKLIGFEDLLSVSIQNIDVVSPQRARVIMASSLAKEPQQKELIWEEVNGKWVPVPFLQRVAENWSRAKIDATPHISGD